MEYVFCARVHALTRRVFGFDFAAWDAEGLWTERYCPHALVLDGRVVPTCR